MVLPQTKYILIPHHAMPQIIYLFALVYASEEGPVFGSKAMAIYLPYSFIFVLIIIVSL